MDGSDHFYAAAAPLAPLNPSRLAHRAPRTRSRAAGASVATGGMVPGEEWRNVRSLEAGPLDAVPPPCTLAACCTTQAMGLGHCCPNWWSQLSIACEAEYEREPGVQSRERGRESRRCCSHTSSVTKKILRIGQQHSSMLRAMLSVRRRQVVRQSGMRNSGLHSAMALMQARLYVCSGRLRGPLSESEQLERWERFDCC